MAEAAGPVIRRMTGADVDAATEALLRGDWGDRREWWHFVTTHDHCLPLVADDGGRIVTTGVATVHGAVGWVGTIYTVPERRRQGHGLAMSRVTCEALEAAGCRSLVLVATPEGRPVYEQLGFAETTRYRVFGREGVPAGALEVPTGVRPVEPADLEAIIGLDRDATGEDRAATLRACFEATGEHEPRGLVVERADGSIGGFLVRPPWRGAAIVAPDPDDAVRLLHRRLLDAGPGRPVRAGILSGNDRGAERLVADGWTELWQAVRMQRGEPLDWHPEAIWGQLGFATG